MNIEEKAKSQLDNLEKLKFKLSDFFSNINGIVFRHLSSKIGEKIINYVKIFNKEKLVKFDDDDFVYLDQLESVINDYLAITSDLHTDDFVENVALKHSNDEFYYPSQLYNICDRCQNISDQLTKKYGKDFQISFQNIDFDLNQSADFKHIVKQLNRNLPEDQTNKKIVENMIESIMKKKLNLRKEEAEYVKKIIKEVGDVGIEDDEIETNENSILGSGGFGTVMKGTYLKTSEEVAVKNIRLDRASLSSITSFLIEIKTMSKIRHPNLLKFVGALLEYPYYIVTRFCSGKSLFERLHNKTDLPELKAEELTKIAYQVALGMEYLHNKGIVHRDLKTSNILLDEYNNAYIADFGLSGQMKNKKEKLHGGVGTPNYTAPEILASIHYNSQVDVYSYSIVLWEMQVKRVPFKDMQAKDIYEHVVRNNWRLPLPQESPNGLKKLITQAWSKNPKDRPTFTEIVKAFREEYIFFTTENSQGVVDVGKIKCDDIENEKHCPHINEEYLLDVLHKKRPKYFDSVVEFIVENMDDRLRTKLRNESILDELIKKPNECYSSTLLLASSLLNEQEFGGFLKNGGKEMFNNALTNHSRQSLSGALTFATKIPKTLISQIEESIGTVVSLLGENDPTPDGIILQLLTRFRTSLLKNYVLDISKFLLNIRLEHIDSQEMFNSFTSLFLLCKDNLQYNFGAKSEPDLKSLDGNQNEKYDLYQNDNLNESMPESEESQSNLNLNETKDLTLKNSNRSLNHFVDFISPKFVADPKFVENIVLMNENDLSSIPALIKNILGALKTSNLTSLLTDLTMKIQKNHPEILDELARDIKALDAIRNCLEDIKEITSNSTKNVQNENKYLGPLLLLFCIASRDNSPPLFSNFEKKENVITSLLEMRKYTNQRLQIFSALTKNETFCENVEDSTMENIIHLISSSTPSRGQHLSNTALRLILAMSTHKKGCLILEKHDVLDLFVQNFLSSNIDINISYCIIRNVTKKNVELPQMKIIVSCLVQSLLYEMSQKETILDTLVALVKKAPLCIQEKDLQDYILFKLEAPIVVLQSLRLLKALKVRKLNHETINNILTHVNQILEKTNYHHPKIINAALSVIKNLINAGINIQNFLDQTKIKEFAEVFLKELNDEKVKFGNLIPQVEDFIHVCETTAKPKNSILNQSIDD